jgi:hypothetical protein
MRIASLGKKLALSLQALALMVSLGGATVAATVISAGPAFAACNNDPTTATLSEAAQCSKGGSQSTNLFGGDNSIFTIAANTLIFLVGAIAVIYLIVGGLRYVVSGGDSKAVTAAKDTILYAIVGIVVAVISYAVVNFVITALAKSAT